MNLLLKLVRIREKRKLNNKKMVEKFSTIFFYNKLNYYMKLKNIISILLVSFFIQFTIAQETIKSANDIMKNAQEQAVKERKNVFVMFTASWCTWCKQMDAKMKDPSIEKLFTNNYVIEKLVVLERKSKKHLENPGAEELLNNYGGEKQGIPFYLIFDSKGNLLADSKMVKDKDILKGEGSNIGCPGTIYEIDAFIYKLKETSNLTDKELLAIAEKFKQN